MHGRPSWNGHFEATFLKSGGGDRVTEWQEVTDQLTSILSNFFCLWFEAEKKKIIAICNCSICKISVVSFQSQFLRSEKA